jgi:hypothetical protein
VVVGSGSGKLYSRRHVDLGDLVYLVVGYIEEDLLGDLAAVRQFESEWG